ncbi:hypothetical protein SEA_PHABIA_5 [Microbacterium phage Phabia]|nr:hypothetical protein SEA_PHABIA_5 [Microbacterium phage Phabia]
MKARYAREIRRGIILARDVYAGRRRHPQLTPCCTYRGAIRFEALPLWQQAYRREVNAMVRDGRIRPPRGPSGIGGRR